MLKVLHEFPIFQVLPERQALTMCTRHRWPAHREITISAHRLLTRWAELDMRDPNPTPFMQSNFHNQYTMGFHHRVQENVDIGHACFDKPGMKLSDKAELMLSLRTNYKELTEWNL